MILDLSEPAAQGITSNIRAYLSSLQSDDVVQHSDLVVLGHAQRPRVPFPRLHAGDLGHDRPFFLLQLLLLRLHELHEVPDLLEQSLFDVPVAECESFLHFAACLKTDITATIFPS